MNKNHEEYVTFSNCFPVYRIPKNKNNIRFLSPRISLLNTQITLARW